MSDHAPAYDARTIGSIFACAEEMKLTRKDIEELQALHPRGKFDPPGGRYGCLDFWIAADEKG